jgi:hypothetical protein
MAGADGVLSATRAAELSEEDLEVLRSLGNVDWPRRKSLIRLARSRSRDLVPSPVPARL